MAIALFIGAGINCRADSGLNEQFFNPPDAAKPWCYWYWLDGDISKEGITKDLENMAEVGIARAMIGNVTLSKGTNNPVDMLSPEWVEATHHAFKSKKRMKRH